MAGDRGGSGGGDTLAAMKQVVEMAKPDLRAYYRMVRKARVVASYASDGSYFADVQPLLNNESPDPKEPVVPRVEIPILWGGPNRGIVCPPEEGTLCDLSYYDGDPNYPRIANFRWQGNGAPECGLTELVIQQKPGVSIKIDNEGSIITITPKVIQSEAGEEITQSAGARIVLAAPEIVLQGNLTTTGKDGGMATTNEMGDRNHTGSYTLQGPLHVNGPISSSEKVSAPILDGKVAGCSGC